MAYNRSMKVSSTADKGPRGRSIQSNWSVVSYISSFARNPLLDRAHTYVAMSLITWQSHFFVVSALRSCLCFHLPSLLKRGSPLECWGCLTALQLVCCGEGWRRQEGGGRGEGREGRGGEGRLISRLTFPSPSRHACHEGFRNRCGTLRLLGSWFRCNQSEYAQASRKHELCHYSFRETAVAADNHLST